MFWVRFWSFIMGYLTIMVEGKSVEKLVNMAVSRGIYLWDISWLGPQKIQIKARVSSFKALRHIVRRTGGRMRIKEKQGLPFKTAKLLKRQMLIAGAVACITILYMLSSFIWFIEVEGNKVVPTDVILGEAEDAGLYVGTAKWKFKASRVEKDLRNELSGLSWVGINVTGTKAVIRVAEKTKPPVTNDTPANIIADKTGLVEEVLVLSGAAVTQEGEMVKKGDLLISGVITTEIEAPGEQQQEDSADGSETPEKIIKKRYVRARGIVKARVWYEGYGEAQLVSRKEVRTGRHTRSLELKIGSKSIIVRGSKTVPYKAFAKEQKVKRLPEWRNIRIPVEIVTTYCYETKTIEEKQDRSQATEEAVNFAKNQLKIVMPAKAKVLNEKLHIIKTKEPNLVRVNITVETQENIGIAKPIDKGEIQNDPFQQNQEGRHN